MAGVRLHFLLLFDMAIQSVCPAGAGPYNLTLDCLDFFTAEQVTLKDTV